MNIYEVIGLGYTILATTLSTALLIYCCVKGLNQISHWLARGQAEERLDQKADVRVIAANKISLDYGLLRSGSNGQVERRSSDMRFCRNSTSLEESCSLLNEGSNVSGELEFSGTLRIDGNFRGAIKTGNILVIGERAVVHADIRAVEIEIHGSVFGNIEGIRRIAIHPTGRIRGDIQTPSLVVAVGGALDGGCRMADEPAGTGLAFSGKTHTAAAKS